MGIFKIKKVFLMLLLFAVTGCSATYSIDIKDSQVIESAEISELKTNIYNKEKNGVSLKEEIDYTFDTIHDKYNVQDGEKTRSFSLNKIDKNNIYGLHYEKITSIDEYNNSPLLKQCYDSVNIETTSSNIIITTSNIFNCFNYYNFLDKVTINLTTNYVVNSHNADKVDNKTYTWLLTKDNYENKTINIDISKEKDTRLSEETTNKVLNITLTLLGILLLVGTIFIVVKVKKANS